MNIAYTLRLLGNDPVPFVYVGQDFDNEYAAHLKTCGVDTSGIHMVDAPHSAHAFIFTDTDQNQFTGFFGGPGPTAGFGPELRRHARGFEFGILAPDLPANMITAATALRHGGVPFLTDPGQNVTDFRAHEATELVAQSTAVIVNEFEYVRLRDLVGDRLDALDLVVVTEGERGARWRSKVEGDGREPAVAAQIVDPTGCGDGFRGGLRPREVTRISRVGSRSRRCRDGSDGLGDGWDANPPLRGLRGALSPILGPVAKLGCSPVPLTARARRRWL